MLGPFHFSLSLTTVSPNPNPPEVPTPARQHRVGPGRLMSLIRSTWGAGPAGHVGGGEGYVPGAGHMLALLEGT